MQFTEQDIKELCPKAKNIKDFTAALNMAFKDAEINNPLRVAAALARWNHESWNFQKMREVWTNTPQQQRYDPASNSRVSRMLGNTQRGDGIKFLGRGLTGITGRFNYTEYSKYAGFDFVKFPEKLEELPHAVMSAAWFWKTRRLNRFADVGDIKGLVRAINGGENGLFDTIKHYTRYLAWFKAKGF